MAGTPSRNGITVSFYGLNGKLLKRKPIKGKHCWVTGQPQKGNMGSADWVREIYIANDERDLYLLMDKSVPKGTVPFSTSGCSGGVELIHMVAGKPKVEIFKSAVAMGKLKDLPPSAPPSAQKLLVIDGFHLSAIDPADLEKQLGETGSGKGSPFSKDWGKRKII